MVNVFYFDIKRIEETDETNPKSFFAVNEAVDERKEETKEGRILVEIEQVNKLITNKEEKIADEKHLSVD